MGWKNGNIKVIKLKGQIIVLTKGTIKILARIERKLYSQKLLMVIGKENKSAIKLTLKSASTLLDVFK